MIVSNNIYLNKKVCLLGNGPSIKNYDIQYQSYDLVVGINRIYKTYLKDKIHILYYNLSTCDWEDLSKLLLFLSNKIDFKLIVFNPWYLSVEKKQYLYDMLKFYNLKNKFIYSSNIVRSLRLGNKTSKATRPLSGNAALNHIIRSKASSVDIYGFDFYNDSNNKYFDDLKFFNHNRYHDIPQNKDWLERTVADHRFITWYK